MSGESRAPAQARRKADRHSEWKSQVMQEVNGGWRWRRKRKERLVEMVVVVVVKVGQEGWIGWMDAERWDSRGKAVCKRLFPVCCPVGSKIKNEVSSKRSHRSRKPSRPSPSSMPVWLVEKKESFPSS